MGVDPVDATEEPREGRAVVRKILMTVVLGNLCGAVPLHQALR